MESALGFHKLESGTSNSTRASMHVHLPEPLCEFVEEQVVARGYHSAADYLAELIEADRRRMVRQQIEAEIIKGIESGPSTPFTKEDWESIRQEVIARHRTRIQRESA
jgi:putative addiction module CopG family antidote